jgi:hypothetical protein
MNQAATWYNAVVRDCGLSAATFQLANGNIPLGDNSTAIWSILDRVPPDAFENYNPTPGNVFSTNYGAILLSLKAGGLVSAALQIWEAAGNFPSVKAYDRTIDDLRAGLDSVPGATVTMGSGDDTADLSGAWAQKGDAGIGMFWQPSRAFSSPPAPAPPPPPRPGTVVEVSFDHVLTFVAGPLSTSDPLNVGLMNYKPWYNSAALNLALADSNAWSDPGQWLTYFAPGTGSMLRCITSLVIVDGVTSKTLPPPAPMLEMNSGAIPPDSVGFWPFAIPAEEPIETETTPAIRGRALSEPAISAALDDSGGVTIRSMPGNPLLLGVNVRSLCSS